MALRIPEKLTEEDIKEFQRIYRNKYGETLSTDDAKAEIITMLCFIASVIEQ